MSNTLNSKDFGSKIYNRFPLRYREDDLAYGEPLRRYIEGLSEGGFAHVIDELNGITRLIDPDNVSSEVLPLLFQQHGLSIFKGIPEEYLRYLLPRLGEAWSKKGSLDVIEYITSSLTGIKTSTEVEYENGEDSPLTKVRLEMDYTIGNYFPNSANFEKLLINFLPFYCDILIVYSYMFYEKQTIKMEEDEEMSIPIVNEETLTISQYGRADSTTSALVGKAVVGVAVVGSYEDYSDVCYDTIKQSMYDYVSVSSSDYIEKSVTNSLLSTLNGGLVTNQYGDSDTIINSKTGNIESIFY